MITVPANPLSGIRSFLIHTALYRFCGSDSFLSLWRQEIQRLLLTKVSSVLFTASSLFLEHAELSLSTQKYMRSLNSTPHPGLASFSPWLPLHTSSFLFKFLDMCLPHCNMTLKPLLEVANDLAFSLLDSLYSAGHCQPHIYTWNSLLLWFPKQYFSWFILSSPSPNCYFNPRLL